MLALPFGCPPITIIPAMIPQLVKVTESDILKLMEAVVHPEHVGIFQQCRTMLDACK